MRIEIEFKILLEDLEEYNSFIRERFSDNFNTINTIFHLDQSTGINLLFDSICNILIDKYKLPLKKVLKIIEMASTTGNHNLKIYWELYKKLYDFYKPNILASDYSLFGRFQALVIKHYNIKGDLKNSVYGNETIDQILDIFPRDSLLYYLMTDDNDSFVKYMLSDENFNYNQQINGKSLLEWCSYYGSVNCFRILRSNGASISNNCLQLSFLGANPDIIHELFQTMTSDSQCMEYSIQKHSIDQSMYLYNNFGIEIM